MRKDISWIEAVFNPSLREEFVSGIDLGEAREFVRELYYIQKPHSNPLAVMGVKMPFRTYFFIKGSKAVITVFPRAFDERVHGTFDDFQSTLFDHEVQHAQLYKKGVIAAFHDEREIAEKHLSKAFERPNCSGRYLSTLSNYIARLPKGKNWLSRALSGYSMENIRRNPPAK